MDAYITRLLDRDDVNRDEEFHWARQARHGDRQARAKLIESGLRAVVLRALMLGFRGEALNEAVQNGTVALIEVVDRFDPDRGARLATFAWWPVAHAMRATIQAAPVSEESDSAPPSDEQDTAGSPDGESLEGWLDGLRPELAAVIRQRYAAAGVRPRGEVARVLGLSEYQVRARETEAMRELTAGLAKVDHRAPQ